MSAPVERAALRLDGMVVSGEHGVRASCTYGGGRQALSVQRLVLDAALVEAAQRAGARFEDGVVVRGPLVDDGAVPPRVRGVVIAARGGRDVRVPAPYVIAADGRRSALAIPLGLTWQPRHPRRWAIGAYFRGVADLRPLGEMHVRRGRYVGVAPVPGDLANVCLVVPDLRRLREPAAVLLAAIARDPQLRARFAGAELAGRPSVLGPLAVDARAAGLDGLLLAGDAAGFIDPMTGDGLRFAIRGGELAAEAVLAALAGRIARPHVALAAARRDEFAGKWRFNRSVRRLVGTTAAVEAAGVVTLAAPWILKRAIRFAGDVPA